MIRKSDVRWWVLEATKHPEFAPQIVKELAKRLIELDGLNEHLRDELIRLRRQASSRTDSTQVQDLRHQVQVLQKIVQNRATEEAAILLCTDRLQVMAIPLSRAQEVAQLGSPILDTGALMSIRTMSVAHPGDELLLLTNLGHGFKLPFSELPAITEGNEWPHEKQDLSLATGERLSATAAIGEAPRFWTVVTRRGYVQRLVRVAFDRGLAQGAELIKSPLDRDEPVSIVAGDLGDLLVFTRWGKYTRFSHRAIENQGSIALELDADDEIAAALSLPSDAEAEMLLVTASGYVMRRDGAQLATRARPGGAGKALIQASDVLSVFPCGARTQLLYLDYSGMLSFNPVTEVPIQDRLSRGVLIRDLRHQPAVAVACIEGGP
jgi:DNA gyrase/topoisomerase IV subunit A